MAKDAYFFSHDSNAKDDPKCVLLIEQLGLEGYGIYWVLIETLRDQSNFKYPIALIPALARRYNTTAEKMKTVVCNYGLFVVDEFDFFSLSLIERMDELETKRGIAQLGGRKSAEQRRLNSGSTGVQLVKESKVNKNIVKENILKSYTDNQELIEAALSFIEMRVSIKKPMTDKALEMMLTKLNTLSKNDSEKIEILNQSTMNCWQGIFELKKPANQIVPSVRPFQPDKPQANPYCEMCNGTGKVKRRVGDADQFIDDRCPCLERKVINANA